MFNIDFNLCAISSCCCRWCRWEKLKEKFFLIFYDFLIKNSIWADENVMKNHFHEIKHLIIYISFIFRVNSFYWNLIQFQWSQVEVRCECGWEKIGATRRKCLEITFACEFIKRRYSVIYSSATGRSLSSEFSRCQRRRM